MEESIITTQTPVLICSACYTNVSEDDAFCDSCGYPLKGTETEQCFFMSERQAKEIDLDDALKKIKKAGYVLYYIAGLTLIVGLIFDTTSKFTMLGNITLGIYVILAAIYLGLGLWSRKKPLAAIISGFSLYILMNLLDAVVSPITLIQGLLFKIVIIGFFIAGIKSAITAEKIKKELNIG